MFIDSARINVYAGAGGAGSEAYRREKGVPRGGPAGGDGGKGGDVVLVVDPQLTTLMDFRYHQHHRAERGRHGEGNNRTGRSGKNAVLRVPPGTIARDGESGELLGELLEPGAQLVVAKGGRGGRGNIHFTSSTHQTPTRWEPGAEGEERIVELELKLLADVGLVGEPNAGKSTFLASVTRARPKVASYPFTTLAPNLGVVELPDFRSFVLADIPGIIEGAHEGKGLGFQFLRHVERTRTLALLVPLDSPDAQAEYELLREELLGYSEALAELPHCVVLTKADLLGPDRTPPVVQAPEAWASFTVSAVSRSGMDGLLEALWAKVRDVTAEESAEVHPEAEF